MKTKEIKLAIFLGVATIISLLLMGVWLVDWTRETSWLKSGAGNLPACGTKQVFFDKTPVAVDRLLAITPLGSLDQEEGAVFPTDRISWLVGNGEPSGNDGGTGEAQIYAPGGGWLTKVAEVEYWREGKMEERDYTIYFSPCREAEAIFYHVGELAPRLREIVTPVPEGPPSFRYGDGWSSWGLRYGVSPPLEAMDFRPRRLTVEAGEERNYSQGGWVIKERAGQAELSLSSGEWLGLVGGVRRHRALAWRLTDERNEPLRWANQDRVDDKLSQVVCPLDYYPADLKKKLLDLVGDGSRKRVDLPVCGRVDQDVAGTLQGVWRAEKTEFSLTEEAHVALVHDAIEPRQPVFSLGTGLEKSGLGPGQYYFSKKETGLINRDFSAAADTGRVYCYQGLRDKLGVAVQRIILAELIDNKSMKMEARLGFSCGVADYVFSDRMTVFER